MPFLSNSYPAYDIGGYDQWCDEVERGLPEWGHTIAVLTSTYGIEEHRQQDENT